LKDMKHFFKPKNLRNKLNFRCNKIKSNKNKTWYWKQKICAINRTTQCNFRNCKNIFALIRIRRAFRLTWSCAIMYCLGFLPELSRMFGSAL
jgi:hypothetical protein